MSFCRTTTVVEAHWSVLKRHYLVLHNRPRPDFVIYLIDPILIPKFYNDSQMLLDGSKIPKWWKDFRREWVSLSTREINGSDNTNSSLWCCTCPAFMRSRFLFCKHLIKDRPCPIYRDVIRARFPPFLQFRPDDGRHYTLLEPQELPASSTALVRRTWHLENDFLSPENEILSSTPTQSSSLADDMKSTLHWFLDHVKTISESDDGKRQLDYHNKTIFLRMSAYRNRVERNLRARIAPRTCEERDTLYLP